jgi:hypothetical protein
MENYKWSFSIAMLNYQRVVVKQRKCWLNQQHNGVKKPIKMMQTNRHKFPGLTNKSSVSLTVKNDKKHQGLTTAKWFNQYPCIHVTHNFPQQTCSREKEGS